MLPSSVHEASSYKTSAELQLIKAQSYANPAHDEIPQNSPNQGKTLSSTSTRNRTRENRRSGRNDKEKPSPAKLASDELYYGTLRSVLGEVKFQEYLQKTQSDLAALKAAGDAQNQILKEKCPGKAGGDAENIYKKPKEKSPSKDHFISRLEELQSHDSVEEPIPDDLGFVTHRPSERSQVHNFTVNDPRATSICQQDDKMILSKSKNYEEIKIKTTPKVAFSADEIYQEASKVTIATISRETVENPPVNIHSLSHQVEHKTISSHNHHSEEWNTEEATANEDTLKVQRAERYKLGRDSWYIHKSHSHDNKISPRQAVNLEDRKLKQSKQNDDTENLGSKRTAARQFKTADELIAQYKEDTMQPYPNIDPPKYSSVFPDGVRNEKDYLQQWVKQEFQGQGSPRHDGQRKHLRTTSAPETPREQHVDEIRRYHEHKRAMTQGLQHATSNSSLNRYFSSLQEINKDKDSIFSADDFEPIPEPDIEEDLHHIETMRIKERNKSLSDKGDSAYGSSDVNAKRSFWQRNDYNSDDENVLDVHEKSFGKSPGGITERLEQLGIDLSFFREHKNSPAVHSDINHNVAKSDLPDTEKMEADLSSKSLPPPNDAGQSSSSKENEQLMVRVCPECDAVNKVYMTWCIECGSVLHGIEPVPMKRKKVRYPPKRNDDIRLDTEHIREDSSHCTDSMNTKDVKVPKDHDCKKAHGDEDLEVGEIFGGSLPHGVQPKDHAEFVDEKWNSTKQFGEDNKEASGNVIGKPTEHVSCTEFTGKDIAVSRKNIEQSQIPVTNKKYGINELSLNLDLSPEKSYGDGQLRHVDQPTKHHRVFSSEIEVRERGGGDAHARDMEYRQSMALSSGVPSLNLDLNVSNNAGMNRQLVNNLNDMASSDSSDDEHVQQEQQTHSHVKRVPQSSDSSFITKMANDPRVNVLLPKKSKSKPEVTSKVRESIDSESYKRKWNRSSIYNQSEVKSRSTERPSSAKPKSNAMQRTNYTNDIGKSVDTTSRASLNKSKGRPVSAGVRKSSSADLSQKSTRPATASYNPRLTKSAYHIVEDEAEDFMTIQRARITEGPVVRSSIGRHPLETYDRYLQMSPRVEQGELSLWLCLPDELLLYVFSFLEQPALATCAQVCSHFKRVACDDTLWKTIVLYKKDHMFDDWLIEIGQHQPVSLTMVQCKGDGVTVHGLRELFRQCAGTLQVLRFSGCCQGSLTGDNILLHAASRCQYLTDVDASWSNVNHNGIVALCDSSDRLEIINLNGCQSITDETVAVITSKHGSSLKTLELLGCFNITNKSLEKIGQTCDHIKNLNLGQCYKLSDSALSVLATQVRDLQSLDLRGCKQIKDNCIRKFAHHCSELRAITLANCPRITDVSLVEIATYIPGIRYIDVSGCKGINNMSIGAVSKSCQNLQYLDVSSTNITHLSVIMIANNCPHELMTLKLNFCQEVTESSLMKLVKNCNKLRSVHLYGHTKIRNIEIIKSLNPSLSIEMLKR